MFQFMLTPAAGKRLIGRALACHPVICKTLKKGILVIVAGTTNAYVAEEILSSINQREGFDRKHFFRGITLSPAFRITDIGRLAGEEGHFRGDVVIKDGKWFHGMTIYDVADELNEGDVILKGANALDIANRKAGVLIGHSEGGTAIVALRALVGRRVRLIIPVGLEKRVPGPIDGVAGLVNSPGVKGMRLLPLPGEVFTEIEALRLLAGVDSQIIAGGGVGGAEGGIWIIISGTPVQEEVARNILESVASEPTFCFDT